MNHHTAALFGAGLTAAVGWPSATWCAAITTASSNSIRFAVSCPSLTPLCSSSSASFGRSAALLMIFTPWSGALQKASKIASPKPHKINGRISPIRPVPEGVD